MIGNDIDLYDAGTANKAYDLSESITTPGYYYHAAVATGAYDVYVDGLITDYVDLWIGASKLTIIEDNFNSSGQILNSGIAANAVNSSQIIDNTITTDDVQTAGLTNGDIDDGGDPYRVLMSTPAAVPDWAYIGSSSITDGSITSDDIGTGEVTSANIENNTITTDDVQTAGLTNGDIDDGGTPYRVLMSTPAAVPDWAFIGSASITDGSIINDDINSSAGIDRSKMDNVDIEEIMYPEYPNTIWVADATYDSFTVAYDYQLSIGTRLGSYMRITADNASNSNDRQICDVYLHFDPKGSFVSWGEIGTPDPEVVCEVRFRANTTNSSYADIFLSFWNLSGSLLYSTSRIAASSADVWQTISVEKTHITTEDQPLILNIEVRVNYADWDQYPALDLGEITFYYEQD